MELRNEWDSHRSRMNFICMAPFHNSPSYVPWHPPINEIGVDHQWQARLEQETLRNEQLAKDWRTKFKVCGVTNNVVERQV